MADPNFMTRNEPVIGANDPILSNTFDRANIEMWGWLMAEHNADGSHPIFLTEPVYAIETGTYTGTGATQTVILSNLDLEIKYIEIYCSDATYGTYLLISSDSMPDGKTKYGGANAFVNNEITSLQTGQFQVGSSGYANNLSTVYYYTVWGTFSTITHSGTYSESEINWIQHGESIEVSSTPDLANDPMTRAGYEYLQKWRVAHQDDGQHKYSVFPTFVKVETGTYQGTSADNVITLQETNASIALLTIFGDLAEFPVISRSTMPPNTAKRLSNTALESNLIKDIRTPGQFTVGADDSVNGGYDVVNEDAITIAAGDGSNTLAHSPDGITWYGLGASIFTTRGRDVAWNGTRFVAVGSGGNSLAYSSDGITWTGLGTSIFSSSGYGVAWNGTRFVAGGAGTNNTLAHSTDGITWTGLGKTIFSASATGFAWNGTRFVAVGQGTNTLAHSIDGITWAGLGTSIFSASAWDVAWNGTRLVAVGQGTNTLAYSSDGITWTGIGTSIFSTAGWSVAWNGIRFVATGEGTNTLAYSTDGITWTGSGISIFSTRGTATVWNGTRFVAGGEGGNSLAYSSDGITWTGMATAIFTVGRGFGSRPVTQMVPTIPLSTSHYAYTYHWAAFYR